MLFSGRLVVFLGAMWWSALLGRGESFSSGRRGVFRGGVDVVVLVVRRPGVGVGSAVPPRPALRWAPSRGLAHGGPPRKVIQGVVLKE